MNLRPNNLMFRLKRKYVVNLNLFIMSSNMPRVVHLFRGNMTDGDIIILYGFRENMEGVCLG